MMHNNSANNLEFELLNKRLENIEHSLEEVKKKDGRIKNVRLGLVILAEFFAIVVVAFGAFKTVLTPLSEHGGRLDALEDNNIYMREDVKALEDKIDNLSKYVYTNIANWDSANGLPADEEIMKVNFLKEYRPSYELVHNEPTVNSKFREFVYVADGVEDDQKYSSDDLCNQTFITGYQEGDSEVFFLGQYNDNYQWYGKCVLNIYTNGKLECIFEGIYNDGALFSYRRISDERDGTWQVADRVDEGDYRTGETWIYKKTGDYAQGISLDGYEKTQILTYDVFIPYVNEQLISYYNGRTADGFYNDDSGYAYLIKYFVGEELEGQAEEPVVRTIYQGRFKNGQFDDDSYGAWYITREPDTTYMYYEGSFSDGKPDHEKERDFQNELEKADIDSILTDKGFSDYKEQFLVQ